MSYSNIPQVQTANTFDQWRIATNSLIDVSNQLITQNFIKEHGSFTIAEGVLVINGTPGVTAVSVGGDEIVYGNLYANNVSTGILNVSDTAYVNTLNVGHIVSSTGQSFVGVQGIQGAQGSAGYVGSNGAPGSQGAQGVQGLNGVGGQGAQGIQGLTGNPALAAPPILRMASAGYTGGGNVFVANSATTTPTATAVGDLWIDINANQSLSANGWAQLPGGLKMAWGKALVTTSNTVISLPAAASFSSVLSVQSTIINPNNDQGMDWFSQVVTVSTSSITLVVQGTSGTSGGGPYGVYWFVIGN